MGQLLLALAAGSVAVLGYSPFEFWWLSPLSLGLLFYLWAGATPTRCFWLGFSYGFGLFMTGISWVYISLKVYGQMPVALAAVVDGETWGVGQGGSKQEAAQVAASVALDKAELVDAALPTDDEMPATAGG